LADAFESGQARSIHRSCPVERVTVAYVCRLLPLTCLAPNIVEVILNGQQPKGLELAEMLGNHPLTWNAQRQNLGASTIDTDLLREVRDCGDQVSLLSTHAVPEAEPPHARLRDLRGGSKAEADGREAKL
jgi:hypothetical protein